MGVGVTGRWNQFIVGPRMAGRAERQNDTLPNQQLAPYSLVYPHCHPAPLAHSSLDTLHQPVLYALPPLDVTLTPARFYRVFTSFLGPITQPDQTVFRY